MKVGIFVDCAFVAYCTNCQILTQNNLVQRCQPPSNTLGDFKHLIHAPQQWHDGNILRRT